MKRILLMFPIFFLLISCRQNQKPNVVEKEGKRQHVSISTLDSCDYVYKNVKERADTLLKYYNLSNSNKGATQFCDNKIFYSFPNSFKGMETLFGYDDKSGAAPLYDYPIGENIIKYFGHLTSIPKDQYYDKYIDICIGGIWQADNIEEAFGLYERLTDDPEVVSSRLAKRKDYEIKSIFRFIFDGPHPKNEKNQILYHQLLPKIEKQNKRLSKLFSEAYNQLMAEDGGH